MAVSYRYDAFGNELTTDSTDTNPFRYCGEYLDFKTGTYYLRARYYDPVVGRFTQQDTITYAHNNPVLYVDENGHAVHIAVGALVGRAVGYVANLSSQLIANGGNFFELDNRSLWAATGAGTLTGSLAALTGGLSLAGTIGSGALLGGMGYGTYNLFYGTQPTYSGYGWSAAYGAGFAGAYHIAAKGLPVSAVKGTGKVFINTQKSAQTVARQFNGSVTELKNGYKIEIPNPSGGNKPVVVRIMNEGSGGRSQSYFRVSIDGKGSYTLGGAISSDRALTHIDMSTSYLNQIKSIIKSIGG